MRHILRKTCSWVLMGIIIMLFSIGLLKGVVLLHIYTCPASTTCSGSFNQGTSSSCLTSPSSDAERYCPVTQELFQATAVGMLDAIMQTAPSSVPAVQELEANVGGLNGSRWWLNATIPAATLIIYLIELGYTCVLSREDTMLKELNLEEVVRAAQTVHVHDLVSSGQLKKTPLRYHSDVGFVDSSRG
jgi:hypothetical protein